MTDGFEMYMEKEMQEVLDLSGKLKIALADAIRRPMGVVPDSADGLLTQDELEAAEERRVKRG